ncbi:MAG: hypothetical protein SCK70_10460 [bacterium]|nr:hypothetical protein [bacterium]
MIFVDEHSNPLLAMDSDGFLRSALLDYYHTNPYRYCHRPIVVKNPGAPLGDVIKKMLATPDFEKKEIIENDVILLWSEKRKQIITAADIFGRLMRGITDHIKK